MAATSDASVHTSSVYIASPEGDTGKSTVALGVLQILCASAARVGVFRPIVRSATKPDYVLELLLDQATADLTYDQAKGLTYEQVHADHDAAVSEIVLRYHSVAAECDAVVIVGSDYTDIVSPSELNFNARIAANLGAPVLLAVRGFGRTPAEIAHLVHVCQAELAGEKAHLMAVIANRCDPDQLDAVCAALAPIGVPTWALPEVGLLTAPTIAELRDAVHGRVYSGDPELLQREALRVMVGGMTAEHILERLTEGMVVIVPADRSDVLLALVNAHDAEGFPSLAGIVMNGGLLPHPTIARLIEGLRPRLPILTTVLGTYDTASAAARTRGRLALGSQRKVYTALSLMERRVDADTMLRRIAVPIPSVMTPQLFEYQLLDRARRDPRHIVLPEGNDDRVLRAAGRVLQRGIARLTLLGEEPAVRARAAELGVDLDDADVIDSQTSPHVEEFAAEYAKLRAHRGMTLERAREIITDVSYFGTMMVAAELADGMVSGAAHTTAHTIRPSFEIIKTEPGVSTVSSIFLMCLSDRVLAYGDCAVVPDPDSQANSPTSRSRPLHTATQFGIEPRIAICRIRQGASGSGADVEKVREATLLVQPASSPSVGGGAYPYDVRARTHVWRRTKLSDSHRWPGGRRCCLPLPEHRQQHLQGGEAQRRRLLLFVPVLQGLNKPVNDLSRGALVADIVNTVAITAIQAQGRACSDANPHVLVDQRGVVVAQVPAGGRRSRVRSPRPGLVERIGEDDGIVTHTASPASETEVAGPIPDHGAGLRRVFETCSSESRPRRSTSGALVGAVGHRVVHGGEVFHRADRRRRRRGRAPSANCPPLRRCTIRRI